jgi:hypothetical protein
MSGVIPLPPYTSYIGRNDFILSGIPQLSWLRVSWIAVNAHKTKYLTVSRDQNTGRIHSMKMDKVPLKVWKSSNVWEQL